MKVRDLMSRSVTNVKEEDGLALALQIMLWSGIRHLPVVREGKVVGLLSERDILPRKQNETSPYRLSGTVRDAMTSPVETIAPDTTLEEAAQRMASRKIGCLPVVEDESILGILTTTDLLGALARRAARRTGPAVQDVAALMKRSPSTVRADDDLLDAAARMLQYGVRHLPVIDADEHVIGMLSDRDVRTAVGNPLVAFEMDEGSLEAHRRATRHLRVSDAMTRNPRVVGQSDSMTRVLAELVDDRVGALAVLDADGRLVGVVSYLDVLAALVRRAPRRAHS